ncbi:MAG: low specificity L-threonine aldolase, partial [Eubacteriaceae bacterium]|nr:low specificity L-threonine aldolase [Eubacteriaceae bacterium]
MNLFLCDYQEGAHPRIMKALNDTNFVQTPGYGEDIFCEQARELIRKAVGTDRCDVHFLVGGTQTNTVVIKSALRPHQGVIAAGTGHINVHETGAIEATGHKVLTLEGTGGKITGEAIRRYCAAHYADGAHEHIVMPGMVYISFPTELGTIYSRKELEDIRKACLEYSLYLFIDGARLGYGLRSPACDLNLPELASLCDVFYIGGTKIGALFGEAVVIMNDDLKKDFRYI